MAAKMTSYGLSYEQVADILGRDVRTVEQWLKNIGKKSEKFHTFICWFLKLNLQFIQS
jgi:transposase